MSRYRNIHVKMWKSADFLALSGPKANARSLFLFLLCGTHTTAIPGVLVAGPAAIAEELDWPLAATKKCLAEITSRGMAVTDPTTRLVYLPGGLPHNRPANPNAVRAWRDEWAMVPPCPLRDRIEGDFRTFLASMGPNFASAWDNVTRNVPANVAEEDQERSVERSDERSVDGSSDRSGHGSLRTRAYAPAAPDTVPVAALRSAGGAGGTSDDDLPPAGAADVVWLQAVRRAGAPPAEPKGPVVADIARLWQRQQGRGQDWPAFCSWLDSRVAEWVAGVVEAGDGKFMPSNGWPWSKFATWLLEYESKTASSSARSPATAVYVPVDTSDAVPPPEGFLEALKGIGGPALNRGRA